MGFWLDPLASMAFLSESQSPATFVLRREGVDRATRFERRFVDHRLVDVLEIDRQIGPHVLGFLLEVGQHRVQMRQSQKLVVRRVHPRNELLRHGRQGAVRLVDFAGDGVGLEHEHREQAAEGWS